MAAKLYVGNLSFQMNDQDLAKAFSEFGTVQSAKIVTDRDTGRSKGFGFVEMASDDEATRAIEGVNGKDLGGRQVRVDRAQERSDGPRGGGGGGGRGRDSGGFGGGGGGGGGGGNRRRY